MTMTRPLDSHGLSIPASGALLDFLPDEVRDAWVRVVELRREENDAHVALGKTNAAIKAADEADEAALGDAIRAGEARPGPVNGDNARRARNEAQRLARGYEHAVYGAELALREAILAADRESLVVELEERAAELRHAAEGALNLVRQHRDEMRAVRSLSLFVDSFPHAAPERYANDQWSSVVRYVLEDLDAIDHVKPTRFVDAAAAASPSAASDAGDD